MRGLIAAAVACAVACSGCAASFVIDMKDANIAELRRDAARASQLALRYRGAPGALLLARDILEHFSRRGSPAWSFQHIRVRRVLVLDPSSPLVDRFHVDVPRHYELTDAEVIIVPPGGGAIVRIGRSKLRAVARPDGSRRFQLTFPRLRAGAIVETRTRIELGLALLARPLHQRVALRHRLPAARVELAFVCPRFWRLSARRTGARGKPLRFELGDYPPDQRVVRYSASDVPALPDEPLSAPVAAAADQFELQIIATPQSADEYSGPTTWPGVASGMRSALGALSATAIPAAVRRVVERAPALRKVEALVEWVQRTVTLDASAGDDSLAQVLKRRRGTRLRIVALTAALVRQLAHIDASVSLVRSSALGRFERRFVSPAAFDAPVLLYRSPIGYRLALPYAPWLPPRVVPGTLGSRPVLLVDGSKADSLLKTPRPDRYAVDIAADATVDPAAGKVRVHERWRYRGLSAASLRYALSLASAGPRRIAALRRRLSLVGADRLHGSGLDRRRGEVVLDMRYTRSRGLLAGDDAIVIKAPRLLALGALRAVGRRTDALGRPRGAGVSLRRLVAALREPRARRLRSAQPVRLHRRLTLALPEGWRAVQWPRFREVHNDFGQARQSCTVNERSVTLDQQLDVVAFDEKARRGHELAKLLAAVTDASEPLVLHRPASKRPTRRKRRRR